MIVLTGASGGIGGRMIPELLESDQVIGLFSKSSAERSKSEGLSFERVDLTQREQIRDFVKRRKSHLKHLTVLHFATTSIDGLAMNYEESDWDQVMSVNLKGAFLLTQALLPIMIQEKWGRIIHISSCVGLSGVPGTIAYSASKTGLMGMSRTLAKEYGRFGITSNLLSLGYFEAGLIDTLSDEMRKKILAQIPAKKLGKINSITNAVRFLVASDYVNGAVINLDGGI
ncbi:MAG: SDR family NAD(P)-dependent oxidoreductase [Verrucomicrobiia bacterium]|jgi:NAD(P)-dependent dehydrogenase (short-subunit alcohol dehydrogenase family)